MERETSPMLVITFPTTTAAMAMDDAGSPELGRLIPIPREISAGCGLAWCAEPRLEEHLLALMKEKRIPFQEMRLIEVY